MVGNRHTPTLVLENKQNENFCITYFFKLNKNGIEKKVWDFEDNTVSQGRGTVQKIPAKPLGFDVINKF